MKPLPPDPMASPAGTASNWNLPNALTLLRLLLVPLFTWLLLREDGSSDPSRVAAFVVFVVASATDYIDGAVARSRGLVTSFGKIADPIADKLLMGAALIGLSLLGELPWWVTVVILFREVGVTVLRFFVIRHGVIAAGRGGKLKTVLQGLAISLYVLPVTGALENLRVWVMGAALIVTVVTGLHYVVKAYRLRTTSDRAAMKRARRKARQ